MELRAALCAVPLEHRVRRFYSAPIVSRLELSVERTARRGVVRLASRVLIHLAGATAKCCIRSYASNATKSDSSEQYVRASLSGTLLNLLPRLHYQGGHRVRNATFSASIALAVPSSSRPPCMQPYLFRSLEI